MASLPARRQRERGTARPQALDDIAGVVVDCPHRSRPRTSSRDASRKRMVLDARGAARHRPALRRPDARQRARRARRVGLRGDGRLIQLNSYENRVFQAFLEDGRVVVAKFYRPGRWSDRADPGGARVCDRVGAARDSGRRADRSSRRRPHGGARHARRARRHSVSRSRRAAARRARRELEDPHTLQWIGRFLGRLHAVGATQLSRSPQPRLASIGFAARDWLREHDTMPPEALQRLERRCRAGARGPTLFDAAGDIRRLRLHGDCHAGNLLWTDAGPHFVDLDDACTGPAMQDLWMLLSGDAHAHDRQLAQCCRAMSISWISTARAAV